jgi:hypothetical protein
MHASPTYIKSVSTSVGRYLVYPPLDIPLKFERGGAQGVEVGDTNVRRTYRAFMTTPKQHKES